MTITAERASWRDRALCLNEDPETFWVDDELDSRLLRRKKIAAAKRICRECPVWQLCREWGITQATGDKWSILGGLTYPERRALRLQEGRKWN